MGSNRCDLDLLDIRNLISQRKTNKGSIKHKLLERKLPYLPALDDCGFMFGVGLNINCFIFFKIL